MRSAMRLQARKLVKARHFIGRSAASYQLCNPAVVRSSADGSAAGCFPPELESHHTPHLATEEVNLTQTIPRQKSMGSGFRKKVPFQANAKDVIRSLSVEFPIRSEPLSFS